MGECIYCKKDAGLFRRHHKECINKHNEGVRQVISACIDTMSSGADFEPLEINALNTTLDQIVNEFNLSDGSEHRGFLIDAWVQFIKSHTVYDCLAPSDAMRLLFFMTAFDLHVNELDAKGNAFHDFVKSSILFAILNGGEPSTLKKIIDLYLAEGYLTNKDLHNILVDAWIEALHRFSDENIITVENAKHLRAYQTFFELNENELDSNGGAYQQFTQSCIFRDISEGRVPVKINLPTEFMLQKDERLLWLFNSASLYETQKQIKKEYVSGFSGISFRVAKGIWIRTGGSRGHINKFERIVRVPIATGKLGFTNKHIYFSGDGKSFRIRYDKIIAIPVYDRGIEIQQEGRAKPFDIETGNGAFLYNIIVSARLAS